MEAVMMEQTIYAHKQTRTPRKNTRAFSYSRSSDQNLAPANFHGGFLNVPLQPSLSFSYSPSASLLPHQYPQLQQQRNPPLLPLPIPTARNHSLPPPTRGLSLPPPNRKMNKPRDHSVTPKKSKSKSSNSKMEESKPDTDIRSMSSSLIVASTDRFGPDPNNLPKNVSKALLPSPSLGTNQSFCSVLVGDLEKFSGSVFSLAPPPSSLPVPKFMLRSKLSCKAQTAGVDAGATDNLCRLLRLR